MFARDIPMQCCTHIYVHISACINYRLQASPNTLQPWSYNWRSSRVHVVVNAVAMQKCA